MNSYLSVWRTAHEVKRAMKFATTAPHVSMKPSPMPAEPEKIFLNVSLSMTPLSNSIQSPMAAMPKTVARKDVMTRRTLRALHAATTKKTMMEKSAPQITERTVPSRSPKDRLLKSEKDGFRSLVQQVRPLSVSQSAVPLPELAPKPNVASADGPNSRLTVAFVQFLTFQSETEPAWFKRGRRGGGGDMEGGGMSAINFTNPMTHSGLRLCCTRMT